MTARPADARNRHPSGRPNEPRCAPVGVVRGLRAPGPANRGQALFKHLKRKMPMTTSNSIYTEIVTVDSEDLAGVQTFCRDHEGSVGKVPGHVVVAVDQFNGTAETRVVEKSHREAALGHEIHETLRADTCRGQELDGLREHRRSGPQRLADPFEPLDAFVVPRVCGIEESDEWTGIYQDHRPILRRNACFTARFASLAGATDQPPEPRWKRR